jgi:hypothetical protein
VKLFKQKQNIDEDDNVEIAEIEEVEKEIMQINEDLQELKTSEYLSLQDDDDGDETDEEALKLEEGWTIDFVDVDDEDDDTFHINLGKLVKRL